MTVVGDSSSYNNTMYTNNINNSNNENNRPAQTSTGVRITFDCCDDDGKYPLRL